MFYSLDQSCTFSDASTKAISAVAYLKTTKTTIPRLDLSNFHSQHCREELIVEETALELWMENNKKLAISIPLPI